MERCAKCGGPATTVFTTQYCKADCDNKAEADPSRDMFSYVIFVNGTPTVEVDIPCYAVQAQLKLGVAQLGVSRVFDVDVRPLHPDAPEFPDWVYDNVTDTLLLERPQRATAA